MTTRIDKFMRGNNVIENHILHPAIEALYNANDSRYSPFSFFPEKGQIHFGWFYGLAYNEVKQLMEDYHALGRI